MKQVVLARGKWLWQVFEAGLFGAIIALTPLGLYAQTGSDEANLLAGAGLLTGWTLIIWLATLWSATARVIILQIGQIGIVVFLSGSLILVGAPIWLVVQLGLVGFLAGLVFGLVRWPDLLVGAVLAAVLVNVGYLFLRPAGTSPGMRVGLWVGWMGLTAVYGGSFLANRLRTSRFARTWGYGLLVLLTWLLPILYIREYTQGSWLISWPLWLTAPVITAIIFLVGREFEENWFTDAWAIPRLTRLRCHAANALFRQGAFKRAFSHYREAHWGLLDIRYHIGQFEGQRVTWQQQKALLGFFQKLGATGSLFQNTQARNRLIMAAGHQDQDFRKLARRIVSEAADDDLKRLIGGVYHHSATVRRFMLGRFLHRELTGELTQALSQRIAGVSPAGTMAIVQTLLKPTPAGWKRLADLITKEEKPGGLDMLAEAMRRNSLAGQSSLVWNGLRQPLFRQLLFLLWEDDLSLARQAAALCLQMGEPFIRPLIETLAIRPFAEQRVAAARLARLALLGAELPGVALLPAVAAPPNQIHARLTADQARARTPLIPVVTLADSRQMILLINQEKYKLHIETPQEQETAVARPTRRLHFIINASDVPVQPSVHQILEVNGASNSLDFYLEPNEVTLDRLTVHLIADGRSSGWLVDYGLFVCDAYVANGLATPMEGTG